MAVPCLTIVNDGSEDAPIQIKWTVSGNMGNALAFEMVLDDDVRDRRAHTLELSSQPRARRRKSLAGAK